MQYQEDIQTALHSLQKLFKDAEAQAKSAELDYGNGPIIPAINELRYAGSHIINFLCAATPEEQKHELDKAFRHCKRSIYDAVEARLMVSFERYKSFRDKYQDLNLLSHIPNILEMTTIAQEIERMIGARQPDETKDEHYSRLIELHEQFRPHINSIDVADIELQKELSNYQRALSTAEEQLKEARSGRKITILSCIVTVIAVIVAVFTWKFPQQPAHASENMYSTQATTTGTKITLPDQSQTKKLNAN